ncbi:MAG: CBS domain-containing protein [Pirellulaceae bacterium]|nr:CBS domain-containing protein [Pirellulaceae bacterium]
MGFREDLEQDQVSSLALRDAIIVRSDTTIKEAVGLMREKSLGCAVIVDQSGTASGIFTEQSLLAALSRQEGLDDQTVGDFSDPSFLSLPSSAPISRVWDAIEEDGLRFICVTGDDGQLIGVTGQRGIFEYLAECFPQQVLVQRLGSKPWMKQREGA